MEALKIILMWVLALGVAGVAVAVPCILASPISTISLLTGSSSSWRAQSRCCF